MLNHTCSVSLLLFLIRILPLLDSLYTYKFSRLNASEATTSVLFVVLNPKQKTAVPEVNVEPIVINPDFIPVSII